MNMSFELTKEQKMQIVNQRRQVVARTIFEHQVDIVVFTAQEKLEEIAVITSRIEQLQATDVALQAFIDTL